MTAFGARLRLARRVRRKTLMDVGEALGVSYQAVQRWEKGDQHPKAPHIWPLAETLGVSVTYLLDPSPLEGEP